MWLKKGIAMAVIIAWLTGSMGCATTPEGQEQVNSAVTGGAIGAVTGGVIGYMVGGSKGAAIGAAAGAALGALSGWAYAKRQQAMREAALKNKRIEYVSDDKLERVVAEPMDQGKIEEENGKKVRKVKVRTYKKDPKTKKEEMTSDTIERVPLEG